MKTYSWEIYCKKDRYEGISEIESLVNKYGAITDFHRFSDLSLSLTVDITPSNAHLLFDKLSKEMDIKGKKPLETESKTEGILYISINFALGHGDLKTEVPNVPG
jgi:hypothetical protein